MALYRQRLHERRVHKLSLENHDLRKDVDKLEDALALHKRIKYKDESSVKGMIRKEVGGSIWQHGGEGKLHTYKSNKDLDDKYSQKTEKQHKTKKKVSSPSNENSVINLQPDVGKVRTKEKSSIRGGSSIGAKVKSPKPLLGTYIKDISEKDWTVIDGRGAGVENRQSMKQRYVIHDADDEDEDDTVESVINYHTDDTTCVETRVLSSNVDNFSGYEEPSQSEHTVRQENSCNKNRAESRIEVLNKMINKLRDSWQLDDMHNVEIKQNVTNPVRTYETTPLDPLVIRWLQKLNLKQVDKYIDIFSRNEIDVESLKLLTENQLKSMGITAIGSLTKILHGIEQLKKEDHKYRYNKETALNQGKYDQNPNENKYSAISSTKSILTTKTGKNTFDPKDLLQELESSSSSEDEQPTKKVDRPAKRDSRPPFDKVNKGASIANKRKSPKADSAKRPSSSTPSSKRSSHSKNTKGNVLSGRSTGRARSIASNTTTKDGESEYGDTDLDRLISIHTVIQDVSVDETEDGLEDNEVVVITPKADSQSIAVVIPQVNNDTPSDTEVDEDDKLKSIEHEIRALADNINRPGVMDRILKLQDQLRVIQKQILIKKKETNLQKEKDIAPSAMSKPLDRNLQLIGLDIEGKSINHTYVAEVTDESKKETEIQKEKTDNVTTNIAITDLEEVKKSDVKSTVNTRTNSTKTSAVNRNMSKGELLKEVRKQKDEHRKQIRHLESELSRLKHKDPLRSCEITESELHFSPQDLIGEGAFSQVYHGSYQGSEVAVKRLKIPLTSQDKNYFMAEVNLLKDLRHPRVVLLVGVCTTSKLPLMVLEFMANGSLYNYLHNAKNGSLDHAAYYQIARDTALGMNYLHLHKPAVLHLDLKSMNVLLNLQLRAKIADFGFSKLRHDADMKAREKKPRGGHLKGTPAWLAPEMLDFKQVTTKADVFSFGVILWEMFTRRHPYQGCSVFQIIERVRTNKRPEIPSHCPKELASLISNCWNKNTAKRPQFKDILITLEHLHFPEEWKKVFNEAGIASATLCDINATRTLISLVNDTLEKVERPSDVPMLELYDSDTEVKNPHFMTFDSTSSSEHDQSDVKMQTQSHVNPKDDGGYTVEEEVAFYDKLASALDDINSDYLDHPCIPNEHVKNINNSTIEKDRVDSFEEKGDQNPWNIPENLNKQLKERRKNTSSCTNNSTGNFVGDIPTKNKKQDAKSSARMNISNSLQTSDDNNSVGILTANSVKASDDEDTKGFWTDELSAYKSLPPPPPPLPLLNQLPLINDNTSNSASVSKTEHNGKVKSSQMKKNTSKCIPQQVSIVDLRASQLVAKRNTLKPTASDPVIDGNEKSEVSSKIRSVSDIRASQLINQRNCLKPTDNPHPQQLTDLSNMQDKQLCDLAYILKKAVDERRVMIAEGNTMDSEGTISWDLTED